MKYLFILDFTDGKVYRYNMKDKVWFDDFEDFIITEGFSLSNVEWMQLITVNSILIWTIKNKRP